MWSIAGALPNKTADKIAAYFSALPPPKGSTGGNPTRVAAGTTIFKQGIASQDVPPCGACHGDKAAGTSIAPRLAGQHREYLFAQLQAFRSNARKNAIMHGNVKHMTDRQMHDVAAYLASL
jgi:cytochrome c553